MEFGIASVAGITVICYLAAQAVKATNLDNKWLPVICGVLVYIGFQSIRLRILLRQLLSVLCLV